MLGNYNNNKPVLSVSQYCVRAWVRLPSNVVDEHKRRARCIWILFLAFIICYTVWLIVSTYEKRKNPSVSLRLEVSLGGKAQRHFDQRIKINKYYSNTTRLSCARTRVFSQQYWFIYIWVGVHCRVPPKEFLRWSGAIRIWKWRVSVTLRSKP